ncbi:MAG: hypothetical protein V1906_03480, partial [Candidatus Woesearchaeota archaeon]
KNLDVPGMNGPVSVVFVNNRAMPKPEFRDYVLKMTGLSGVASKEQMFGKEPFKSMKDKFTIYYIDEASMPIGARAGTPLINMAQQYAAKSCPAARHVVIVSSDPSSVGSAATADGKVFLEKRHVDLSLNTLSHEYAHACCALADEYVVFDKSHTFAEFKRLTRGLYLNCAFDAADALSKSWPQSLISHAQSGKWQGCGGTCPVGCESWLKPSKESIMSKSTLYDDFNAFSAQIMRERLK